ncbi:recombinase family protein [Streptomyces brasiliensis]|uniref:Resolvase/invertase-type recombinase catalytic domain-containing protein n=1 Tax=Streptomyces brasiliensis TaxID=1954 RepID=A0A917NSP5_9ACTN|nr:recombinase family protein [Streptomyces brasiliensis]GGJ21310.1 hypothetical protein GCM10010121_035450 [Streptomyces brasiliensis]
MPVPTSWWGRGRRIWRISTFGGARRTLDTLKQHARELRREIERQGLTVRKVWLEQRSASKQHIRREKLEGAMADVIAGEVKTLAVWKTDRFDRRGMAAVGAALDEFDRRKARLYVLQEGLDSSQPGSRIVFAILAERAREEIKDLTLRVTTGKAAGCGQIKSGAPARGERVAKYNRLIEIAEADASLSFGLTTG